MHGRNLPLSLSLHFPSLSPSSLRAKLKLLVSKQDLFSNTVFVLAGLVTSRVPLAESLVLPARSYEPEGRYTQTSFTYRQKKSRTRL